MYKSSGRLLYDPTAEKQVKTREDPYWLILECDAGISLYYRYWLKKAKYIDMIKPAWGAHISITRGEKITNKDAWKKHSGKKIDFEYVPEVKSNGKHFWLSVISKELEEIRTELGLSPTPYWGFHLTIGNKKE